MRRLLILLLCCAHGAGALAGNLVDGVFRAGTYAPFEIDVPAGQWQAVDREKTTETPQGGAMAELRSVQPVGSIYPVLILYAFPKTGEEVTADFLLRTSRQVMTQKGAQPGPVLVRKLGERKIRYFDARIEKPAGTSVLYYVLLEGDGLFYSAQVVSPEDSLELVRTMVDRLLTNARY